MGFRGQGPPAGQDFLKWRPVFYFDDFFDLLDSPSRGPWAQGPRAQGPRAQGPGPRAQGLWAIKTFMCGLGLINLFWGRWTCGSSFECQRSKF